MTRLEDLAHEIASGTTPYIYEEIIEGLIKIHDEAIEKCIHSLASSDASHIPFSELQKLKMDR